jgi:benzoyl-CoA-dihydrodiol lyase
MSQAVSQATAGADHAQGTPATSKSANDKLANGKTWIDFQTAPSRYHHWKLAVDGDVATLTMDVDEKAGLFEGYDLKLNSYDLGVDIELADAIERLRFEYPQARALVLRSASRT